MFKSQDHKNKKEKQNTEELFQVQETKQTVTK